MIKKKFQHGKSLVDKVPKMKSNNPHILRTKLQSVLQKPTIIGPQQVTDLVIVLYNNVITITQFGDMLKVKFTCTLCQIKIKVSSSKAQNKGKCTLVEGKQVGIITWKRSLQYPPILVLAFLLFLLLLILGVQNPNIVTKLQNSYVVHACCAFVAHQLQLGVSSSYPAKSVGKLCSM